MVDTAEFERDLLARIVQNIKPSKAAIFSGQNYQMSVSHGVETDQDELNMELVEKVVQTEGPVSDKVHKRQLAVPYKNAEGKVLGVMYVEIAAPRRLKFRDLAILQGLGRQMVERHWQPTKAPESSLNPETLSEVTRYVRSTLSIVSSVLKPQRVLILVRFEDGPKIVASRGFDDVQNLSEVPFSRELVDSIWEKGETCHIRDAANDPQYSKFAGVKEHSLRSVCVCPLNKLDGEDRGLIYLDSCKDPAEFLTAEVSILQRLALALEKDLARVLAPESDLEAGDVLGSSSSSILDNDNEYSLPDVSSYLDEPDSFVVNDSEETDPTDEAESISDDYHSSALFEEEEKLDDVKTEEPEPEEGEAEEPVEEAEEQREDESAEELADEADEFDDEAEETEVAEEQLDDDQVEELANEADEFDDEADQQTEEVVDEEAEVAEEQLDDQQVEEPEEFDDESDDQAEEVVDEEAEVAEEQLDDQQVEEPEEFDDESDERAEEVDDEESEVAEEQLDDQQVEKPEEQIDDDEGEEAGEDAEEQVEGADAPEEEAEELDETVDEEVAEEAEELDGETTETDEHVDEDGELDQDSDELEQPEPTFEDTESTEHGFDDEEDEESDEEEPESEPTVEQQGESSPPPLLDLYDGSPLNGDTEYQYEPSENDLVTITLPPQLLDDPEEEEEEEEADSDEIEPTVEETAPPFQREEDSEVDSVRALPVDATVEVSAEIAARALAGVRALQKQQETDDAEVEQAAEDSELEDEADTHVGEPEADSEEVDDNDDEADGEEDSEETDEDEESDTEDDEETEEESDAELKDDADTHVGETEADSEEADNDEEEAAADGEDDEDDSYDADEEETEADTELEDDADSHVGKTESKSEEVDDEEAPTEGEDDEGEDEEDADDEDDDDLEEVEESETDTELPDDADSHVGKTEADSEEVDEQDESDEEEDSEDEDSDEEADSGDDEDSAEEEEEDELEEEEPKAAEPSTAPPTAAAAAAPVKPPAEVAEQEESLMKYVERGLQAVTPAKKATFWERLKWVFSPESVPQGGDYSHIHIAGKVVLQDNDWNDDEPIEVTLGFPSHNMTVILEIAKGEADYAYHGRFEGDSPVWFEVTVEKPGYFPIKLSKVTFKAGDVDGHGEPATRVHEITLIPRKD